MQIIKLIKNIYRFITLILKTGNIRLSYVLYENNVSIDEFIYEKYNNKIILKKINAGIYVPRHYFIIKSIDTIEKLIERYNLKILVLDSQNILFEINGTKMYVETWEDLYIIKEIYLNKLYNLNIPFKHIFIDVGANVGYASLFYSRLLSVEKIIGFEPVKKTYEKALKNISLNPDLEGKIEFHNYGIAGKNIRLKFEYSEEFKGSVGIRGLSSSKKNNKSLKELVDVELKDIKEVIRQLNNEKLPLVLKIDTEGAEYDIVRRLWEENLLGNIKVLIIEWHDKGDKELIKYLNNSDYYILSLDFEISDIGMLYAFKK